METRILLAEDDQDLANFYKEEFSSAGFTDIIHFDNTSQIVEGIRAAYDKPCILVSDYYISPAAPTRYIPELRRIGIKMPAIIISAKIKPEQLNSLMREKQIHGFFLKTLDPEQMIGALCQHLAEINADAHAEFEAYGIRREITAAIADYGSAELFALKGFMSFKTHGEMDGDYDLSSKRLYAIRQEHLALMEGRNVPLRYLIASELIEERCRQLA
jgi:DNA-binding response OmpR family regulator